MALLGVVVLAVHLGLLAREAAPPLPEDRAAASERAAPSAITVATPVVVTQVRQVPREPSTASATPSTAAPPAPRVTRPRPPPLTPAPVEVPEAATETPAPAPMPAEAAPLLTADSGVAQAAEAPVAATTAPEPPDPAPTLPPSDLPPSATLPYEVRGQVRGMDYHARGALEWRLDAQGYEARMELSMLFLGSRVQTSRGGVGPEGLRPERFADRRSSERAAHFDRETGRIRFSNNAPAAALAPGAQDRLSLFMQLAGLLRARAHSEGETIEFQVAGVGDAQTWRFEVAPMETLDLPAGAIEARRLVRTPRKEHDSTVEVWLAPSLGHLPVRLRIAQSNGDVADQRLARWP
jgi:hypothetical protein